MSEKRTHRTQSRGPQRTDREAYIREQKQKYARKHRRKIVWKRFLPMLALLAIFLYGMVSLIRYAAQSITTRRTNAELVQIYEQAAAETPAPLSTPDATPAPTPLPSSQTASAPPLEILDAYQYIGNAFLPGMEELYAKNPDLVAWIRIPGVVDLPVVYRDNTYYMDHDFNGKQSNSGTLFLDVAHPFEYDTQYMVIHGHSMYDGSMFGGLTPYHRKEFMDEHTTVYFSTLYREEEYEVIGVLRLPEDRQDEGYLAYTGTRSFKNVGEFYAFADKIRESAAHWKEGAEMLPTDALLALSTCFREDERIVLICRRTAEHVNG